MAEPVNLRWAYIVRHEPLKAQAEISGALTKAGGNRTVAAAALGISRSALYKYLSMLSKRKK